MAFIIGQPPEVTHINKMYYVLWGNLSSDETVTRRIGYKLFNDTDGTEMTPMRSFDPLGQGKFHRIEFQKNIRKSFYVRPPSLGSNVVTHYPFQAKEFRLETYKIEINNETCERTVQVDDSGDPIFVLNGVMGFDEEEFVRISDPVSILTNKFYNGTSEITYAVCPNEKDYIYVFSREANTTDVQVTFKYSIGNSIFIGDYNIPLQKGVSSISLVPKDLVGNVNTFGALKLSIGKLEITLVEDDCNCEDEDDSYPLYGFHPYGGFDNMNMDFVDTHQLDRLNEVVRISDLKSQQTEFRNIQRGFITINHENKDQKVWSRRMPNTRENRRWAKYILSSKRFVTLDRYDYTDVLFWRNVTVGSATYTISKEQDEIQILVTGYFNQPIPVQ